MKFKGTKLSKRTLALLAAAIILLGSGGAMSTRAALTITSDDYDATIALDEISVDLTENGNAVADGGALYTTVKESKFIPGKTYEDSIGVQNSGTAPEYIRVIVRKYWTNPKGDKDTELDPALIELAAADGWTRVESKNNKEYAVYYYSKQVKPGASVELFPTIRINENVLIAGKKIMIDGTEYASDAAARDKAKAGDKITYTYTYDGYQFVVEAEAQAIQTHNAKDAIKSVWGVDAASVGIEL